MQALQKDLQPWRYATRHPGYVRLVFTGDGGYSSPVGGRLATVQLNTMSREQQQYGPHNTYNTKVASLREGSAMSVCMK